MCALLLHCLFYEAGSLPEPGALASSAKLKPASITNLPVSSLIEERVTGKHGTPSLLSDCREPNSGTHVCAASAFNHGAISPASSSVSCNQAHKNPATSCSGSCPSAHFLLLYQHFSLAIIAYGTTLTSSIAPLPTWFSGLLLSTSSINAPTHGFTHSFMGSSIYPSYDIRK